MKIGNEIHRGELILGGVGWRGDFEVLRNLVVNMSRSYITWFQWRWSHTAGEYRNMDIVRGVV